MRDNEQAFGTGLEQERDRIARTVVDRALDYGIITLSCDGIVTSWNPGAERLFGWNDREMVGQDSCIIFTPEDLAKNACQGEMDTAKQEGRAEDERWHVRKDGSRFWASGMLMRLDDEQSGRWLGFVKMLRDRTHHKVREDQLRSLTDTLEEQVAQRTRELLKAEEALRQSQKMEAIGQLTGGVAHDFNNLLTIIRSAIDLLQRPDLKEERRARYMEAISETVDRATKLTRQLLAFARRQALDPEVFDVAERTRGIADMVQAVVGARVQLNLDIDGQDLLVEADAGQFETAIVNLAVNARDAMAEEGTIAITVCATQNLPRIRGHGGAEAPFVAVSVSDTGSGIAPEVLPSIFEPFFTTKEVGKGTGLGLSQVYGFAKQSGGDVEVRSELGKGAVFTLFLPQVSADRRQVDTAAEAPASGQVKRRILVVEDNVRVGEFSTQLLEELGHTTTHAPNALAALRLLEERAEDFDVVFTDVVMPGMSGVELAEEVRRSYPDLRVILTSGYSHVLAEQGTHGFDLLQKPYSVDGLTRLLQSR